MTVATIAPGLLGTNVTLSGGNLIATKVINSVQAACLCTPVLSSGKYYWEVVASSSDFTNGQRYGVAIYTYTGFGSAVQNSIGQDNQSLGYGADGTVVTNNSTVSTIQTFATGNNIGIALDVTNSLIWFRTNGGNWNNSGTANPATGVGGIALSGAYLPVNALRPAIGLQKLADTVTVNFGGSGFAYTAPTGFLAPNTWTVVAETITSTKMQANQASTIAGGVYPTIRADFNKYKLWSPASAAKFISGTVKEGSTPVTKTVMLYDTGGLQIGQTLSVGGSFTLNALDRTNVFCVAFDPTSYQAVIFDQLTPV